MKYLKSFAFLAAVCALAVSVAAGAVAGSRHRGLERLLDRHEFSEPEKDRAASSFDIVLKTGISKKEALALVETALDGGFDAGSLSRILSLTAQLGVAGLPVEGFISKVEEGVAKRVEPADILLAAERRALMFKRADNILDGLVLQGFDLDDPDELLAAVAAALESGKKESDLRRLLVPLLEEGKNMRTIRRKLLR
jgi:hypothetical protein